MNKEMGPRKKPFLGDFLKVVNLNRPLAHSSLPTERKYPHKLLEFVNHKKLKS